MDGTFLNDGVDSCLETAEWLHATACLRTPLTGSRQMLDVSCAESAHKTNQAKQQKKKFLSDGLGGWEGLWRRRPGGGGGEKHVEGGICAGAREETAM